MANTIVGSGRTSPGQGWVSYYNGMYIDVDTSGANFQAGDTPVYTTSISGTGAGMWNAVGASAVYSATRTGFRIYLHHYEGEDLPPSFAEEHGWYIAWVGVQQLP